MLPSHTIKWVMRLKQTLGGEEEAGLEDADSDSDDGEPSSRPLRTRAGQNSRHRRNAADNELLRDPQRTLDRRSQMSTSMTES